MSAVFSVTDESAIHALHAYAGAQELRGRGQTHTLRRLAKYLVSFALARIPKGDAGKVRDYLRRQVASVQAAPPAAAPGASKAARARAARADALRNTVAARIVRALDIYGAKGLKGDAFYARVNRFIMRRVAGVNVHRASLLEARKALKVGAAAVPRLRGHTPGDYREQLVEGAAQILIDAWGSARPNKANPHPKGMAGTSPGAFSGALADLIARVEQWTAEAAEKAARRLGLA